MERDYDGGCNNSEEAFWAKTDSRWEFDSLWGANSYDWVRSQGSTPRPCPTTHSRGSSWSLQEQVVHGPADREFPQRREESALDGLIMRIGTEKRFYFFHFLNRSSAWLDVVRWVATKKMKFSNLPKGWKSIRAVAKTWHGFITILRARWEWWASTLSGWSSFWASRSGRRKSARKGMVVENIQQGASS